MYIFSIKFWARVSFIHVKDIYRQIYMDSYITRRCLIFLRIIWIHPPLSLYYKLWHIYVVLKFFVEKVQFTSNNQLTVFSVNFACALHITTHICQHVGLERGWIPKVRQTSDNQTFIHFTTNGTNLYHCSLYISHSH